VSETAGGYVFYRSGGIGLDIDRFDAGDARLKAGNIVREIGVRLDLH
jgi:hypothetical protein